MGKTKFSFEKVLEVAKTAKTKYATAQALGVSFVTLRNYCRRWPSLEEFFRETREELVSAAESGLWRYVQEGAPWAIAFTLRTLGKDQGYTERREVVEISEPLEIVTKVVRRDAKG